MRSQSSDVFLPRRLASILFASVRAPQGHLDHLGIRDGQIYPGFVDNASGAAATLALAVAFGQHLSWSCFRVHFAVAFVRVLDCFDGGRFMRVCFALGAFSCHYHLE